MRPAEQHSPSAEENCLTENVASLRSVKVATPPCTAYAVIPCGLAVRKQHEMLFAASKLKANKMNFMEQTNRKLKGVLNMKFPFYDAPNTATITCCHILENGEPILYVSHDEDDGMWQFLCGKAHETDEAKLVSLKSVFDLDNSVGILKDMPCGYYAERKAQDDEWSVRKR